MIEGDLKVGDKIRSTASGRIGEVLSIDPDKEFMDVVVEWDKPLQKGPKKDTHSSKGLAIWAERVKSP